MEDLYKLIQGDSAVELSTLDSNSINLTVTSPPYDDLRTYGNIGEGWNWESFCKIAQELYRVTTDGGIVVWIVGDATKDGSETGTSFKQALYFKEIGFNLHDTMIYEKNSSSYPAQNKSNRYTQIFEYMFVLSKGKPSHYHLICDKKNKWAGHTSWGIQSYYNTDGDRVSNRPISEIPEFSPRNNIWKYSVGFNDKTDHPAVFPEKLAEDHILSWSDVGDTVLDPFMGSGTTGKMAIRNNRKFVGIEINPEYFNLSQKRLENAFSDKSMNLRKSTEKTKTGSSAIKEEQLW